MVIARPIKKNRWVDRMVAEIRKAAGLEVIPIEKASSKVIRALSQNRVVGILIDQRAKRSEGIWVDFFGRKASTTPALAVLGDEDRSTHFTRFHDSEWISKASSIVQRATSIGRYRGHQKGCRGQHPTHQQYPRINDPPIS